MFWKKYLSQSSASLQKKITKNLHHMPTTEKVKFPMIFFQFDDFWNNLLFEAC